MRINPSPANRNKYTFNSLEGNLEIGKLATREFRQKYGRLQSNSWVNLLACRARDKGKEYSINQSHLKACRDKYNLVRGPNGDDFIKSFFYSYEDLLQKYSDKVKTFKFGNCGEQCILMNPILQSKGVFANIISLDFIDKKGWRINLDHEMNLISKYRFNPHDKSTWAKDLVAVDTWGKSDGVIPVEKMEDYYHDLFNIPKSEFELDICGLDFYFANNKIHLGLNPDKLSSNAR